MFFGWALCKKTGLRKKPVTQNNAPLNKTLKTFGKLTQKLFFKKIFFSLYGKKNFPPKIQTTVLSAEFMKKPTTPNGKNEKTAPKLGMFSPKLFY